MYKKITPMQDWYTLHTMCLYLHVHVDGVWFQGLSLGPTLIDYNLFGNYATTKSTHML